MIIVCVCVFCFVLLLLLNYERLIYVEKFTEWIEIIFQLLTVFLYLLNVVLTCEFDSKENDRIRGLNVNLFCCNYYSREYRRIWLSKCMSGVR